MTNHRIKTILKAEYPPSQDPGSISPSGPQKMGISNTSLADPVLAFFFLFLSFQVVASAVVLWAIL